MRKVPIVDTSHCAREESVIMASDSLKIRPATEADVQLLVEFIRALAEYEKLLDEVVASKEIVRESLFGEKTVAEALIGEWQGESASFAVYFQNFSTFTGRAGLYLEDLFVKPEYRQRGIGKLMLKHLAKIAVERGCPRFEWIALDWNEPAIKFYEGLGARQLTDKRYFRMSGEALKQLAVEG
jgi:ribosomal protein S18 acetylase RimI-like enzyme